MALDFPSSPAVDQTYTYGSYTWRWDGTSWVGAVPIVNATINNSPIGATTPSTGAFTTLTANGVTTITNNTASTTSANGALVVTGGVGIGGALNTGGAINSGGDLAVTGNLTVTPSGATNSIITKAVGTSGFITFNGATTKAGNIGLSGGASGDSNMYVHAPTGGYVALVVNGNNAIIAGSNAIAMYTYLNVAATVNGGNASLLTITGTLAPTGSNQTLYADNGFSGTYSTSTYTGLGFVGRNIPTPTVTGTGTIANAYMLYINAAPAATNKYGIYQAGTDTNYLAGAFTCNSTIIGGGTSISNIAGVAVTNGVKSTGGGNWTWAVQSSSSTSNRGLVVSYSAASPNDTGNEMLFCYDSTGTRFSVRSNGGIANYQANNVDLSDERMKKEISPIGSYWDKIKNLQVVRFKYRDQKHDDFNIGVIAQQVEQVAPEFVDVDGFSTAEHESDLKSIYQSDLHYAALRALQEAMAEIESLRARVAQLEAV